MVKRRKLNWLAGPGDGRNFTLSLVLAISWRTAGASGTIARCTARCSRNGQRFREEFPFAWGIVTLAAEVFWKLREGGGGERTVASFSYTRMAPFPGPRVLYVHRLQGVNFVWGGVEVSG